MSWISKIALSALVDAIEAVKRDARDLHEKHSAELAIERTKVAMLERALATSQNNLDWMRVFANQLSEDRRLLAAARGIDLAAPRFEGSLQSPADVEARAVETAKAREAAGGAPVEVGRAIENAGSVDDAMAAYTGHVGNFEDLGDDEAARQGIVHNEADGSVEYRSK